MRSKYHDGRHSHPLFHTWNGMIRRCHDPKKADYNYYGGRGITVCDRWHDFWKFVEDMEPKPDGLSLDRIDNDKGYSKDNCRWISLKKNCNNRRDNTITTWAGVSLTISEMSDLLEINYSTLRSRVRRTGDIFNPQRDRKLEKKVQEANNERYSIR